MYTITQDIKNIQRLKTDAPGVYETYRVKRVTRIKEELATMRAGYKSLPPEEQRRLTLHADNLKTILNELGDGGAETHQAKAIGNTAHDQTEAIHS